MEKDKQVLVDSDTHEKLKTKASSKRKSIKKYLGEILEKELGSDDSNE